MTMSGSSLGSGGSATESGRDAAQSGKLAQQEKLKNVHIALKGIQIERDQLRQYSTGLEKQNEALKSELNEAKKENNKKISVLTLLKGRLRENKLSDAEHLVQSDNLSAGHQEHVLDRLSTENAQLKETLRSMSDSKGFHKLVQEVSDLRKRYSDVKQSLEDMEKQRDEAMGKLKGSELHDKKQIHALMLENRRVQLLERHEDVILRNMDLQEDHIGVEATNLVQKLQETGELCQRLQRLVGPRSQHLHEVEKLSDELRLKDATIVAREREIAQIKEALVQYYNRNQQMRTQCQGLAEELNKILQYNIQWQKYYEGMQKGKEATKTV